MKLQEMITHFFRLYGRRNSIFLSGIKERIDNLSSGMGDLQEAIRKEAGLHNIGVALARVVSRIFCIAQNFENLPLVEMMARKFPQTHCSYCGKIPCVCSERRPEARLEETASDVQLNWSLEKWCSHFNELYGAKNKGKGIENLLNRLFKEIIELGSLPVKLSRLDSKISLEEIEREFALELADCLSWTIAVANFFEIDLEKSVLDRYGKGCQTCGKNPCNCTFPDIEPVRWN